MTRVVVIGSAGFLGRALTRALAAAGVNTAEFTRETPFVIGNGSPAMELRNADSIVYLAGSVTPATAEQDPATAAADLRLFDLFIGGLRGLDRRPVVVVPSSGGTIYDPAEPPPYAETSPTRPVTVYGRTRLEMEHRFLAGASESVRAVILRISNAYGPGQRLGRGQGVTAHWMAAAARGEPLRVFGDPAATRDYVYVDDVVDAMQLLLTDPPVDLPQVLNIGSGLPTTLWELSELVSSVVGGAEIKREPGRSFDRHDTWLDVRLAERALGWVPRVPLIEGLRRTWDHVRASVGAAGGHSP